MKFSRKRLTICVIVFFILYFLYGLTPFLVKGGISFDEDISPKVVESVVKQIENKEYDTRTAKFSIEDWWVYLRNPWGARRSMSIEKIDGSRLLVTIFCYRKGEYKRIHELQFEVKETGEVCLVSSGIIIN